MNVQCNSPVLFLIFNRPDVTRIVFEAIRKAQPSKLYVAADGPRSGRDGEKEKCEATRAIIESIDWKCEVKKLFREKNLGCKVAVSSAIDWFFQQEEEGIILEDDCLPHPSFFSFCSQLLDVYRTNESVMHIGGTNFQYGRKRGEADYYFSRYSHVWGWASWRRAWKKYDVAMKDFPGFKRNKKINDITPGFLERIYWLGKFEQLFLGKIDTWDYQWNYTIWNNRGLSIVPKENMVSNIGFTGEATHTSKVSKMAGMPVSEVEINTHPSAIAADPKADEYSFNTIYKKSFAANVWMLLRYITGKIV